MPSIPMTPAGMSDAESPSSKLMTPNEAPRKTDDKAKPDTPDIIQIAKRLYEQAKRSRKKREAKWDEYWKMYDGDQWPMKRAATKASPNCNIIRSTIATIAPILTDTSPSFGIVAHDPADFKFAELMSQVLKVWWDRRSMNHSLIECLMDSLITDVGIMKVTWNDQLNDGLGDVDVTVVDPKRIYVAENTIDFDKCCPFVIHEFFKRRGELVMDFPDKRDDVMKAGASQSPSDDTTDADTRVRVVSPVNKDIPGPDNADDSSYGHSDDIKVWELWLEDDEVVEEEVINTEGPEAKKSKVMKKKYPHGRTVTLLPDCKIVLQDVPNPYRDGDKPFVRIVDMLRPRSFYGDGEVGQLSETQRMIYKAFATIIDWANLMSNPTWIVDSNSGVDPEMITSAVGQVIVKKPGSEVRREPAPPIPPQMFELYHTLMSLADVQSGVHEVTQGRKPSGITAAAAIETLQEAAQTRIRLKERNMLASLIRLGRLIMSRMLQFYSEPRVIRLTGRDDMMGIWPTYIRFYVEQEENENGDWMYKPVSQKITYDESTDSYVEGQSEEGQATIGDFELDVTSGTSLPFIKQQRSEQAMRLFDQKAIDQLALLDVLDFPEKDAIISRMGEQQAAAAEQAPPPEAGPPPGAV